MSEQDIMKSIQVELSSKGYKVFRTNVGQGWTGTHISHPNGTITLMAPRVFNTGLPVGFSDLLVVLPSGKVAFIEVKTPTGKVSVHQAKFLNAMRDMGCKCGVARSVEEAVRICAENA